MKVIKLDSTFNTRDLSYYKTKDGKSIKENRLIRSGHLHTITENDIKITRKRSPMQRGTVLKVSPPK